MGSILGWFWIIDIRNRIDRRMRKCWTYGSYGRTIAHGKRREDDTLTSTRSGCSMRSLNDPIFPLLLLTLIWMKEDSSGGRKERKIELGVKILEERMVDKEHDEHSTFQPRKIISFQ